MTQKLCLIVLPILFCHPAFSTILPAKQALACAVALAGSSLNIAGTYCAWSFESSDSITQTSWVT